MTTYTNNGGHTNNNNTHLRLDEIFESAVKIVRSLPKDGPIKPANETKLKFYSLFKQATHGPNDTAKPRFYQVVEGYKWDAWSRLGDMSKEEAMKRYIGELRQAMEAVPRGTSGPEEAEYFRNILGGKFFDYWFNQWNGAQVQVDHQNNESTQAGLAGETPEPGPQPKASETLQKQQQQQQEQQQQHQQQKQTHLLKPPQQHKAQSTTSGGGDDDENESDISGDGWRTPRTTTATTLNGTPTLPFCDAFSEQFSSAILRLHLDLRRN